MVRGRSRAVAMLADDLLRRGSTRRPPHPGSGPSCRCGIQCPSRLVVKVPPKPFKPAIGTLPSEHRLYRVFTNTRAPTVFNPGPGKPTRFGFFGDPVVPILYAADTEEAAVA